MRKERKGNDVQRNQDSIGDAPKQSSVLHHSENIHAFLNDEKHNQCSETCLHVREQQCECLQELGRYYIDQQQI